MKKLLLSLGVVFSVTNSSLITVSCQNLSFEEQLSKIVNWEKYPTNKWSWEAIYKASYKGMNENFNEVCNIWTKKWQNAINKYFNPNDPKSKDKTNKEISDINTEMKAWFMSSQYYQYIMAYYLNTLYYYFYYFNEWTNTTLVSTVESMYESDAVNALKKDDKDPDYYPIKHVGVYFNSISLANTIFGDVGTDIDVNYNTELISYDNGKSCNGSLNPILYSKLDKLYDDVESHTRKG